MPVTIRGKKYYRTKETCELAGIGRSTFLRLVREGKLKDASHRDMRGWRLFSEADIERIEGKVNHVTHVGLQTEGLVPQDALPG